ncbi:unnamed protein product, partial [Amoebophrya sp. A120]|eukprot:GSA120T00012740001.1
MHNKKQQVLGGGSSSTSSCKNHRRNNSVDSESSRMSCGSTNSRYSDPTTTTAAVDGASADFFSTTVEQEWRRSRRLSKGTSLGSVPEEHEHTLDHGGAVVICGEHMHASSKAATRASRFSAMPRIQSGEALWTLDDDGNGSCAVLPPPPVMPPAGNTPVQRPDVEQIAVISHSPSKTRKLDVQPQLGRSADRRTSEIIASEIEDEENNSASRASTTWHNGPSCRIFEPKSQQHIVFQARKVAIPRKKASQAALARINRSCSTEDDATPTSGTSKFAHSGNDAVSTSATGGGAGSQMIEMGTFDAGAPERTTSSSSTSGEVAFVSTLGGGPGPPPHEHCVVEGCKNASRLREPAKSPSPELTRISSRSDVVARDNMMSELDGVAEAGVTGENGLDNHMKKVSEENSKFGASGEQPLVLTAQQGGREEGDDSSTVRSLSQQPDTSPVLPLPNFLQDAANITRGRSSPWPESGGKNLTQGTTTTSSMHSQTKSTTAQSTAKRFSNTGIRVSTLLDGSVTRARPVEVAGGAAASSYNWVG